MFEKDNHVRSYALNMWANYIETGDPIMSAHDATNCKKFEMINSLTGNQVLFVERLRKLADEEF